jgi:hypothetical protein
MSNPEKKGGCGGCLGKGCLVLIVVAAIFVGIVFFSYQRFIQKARKYTAQTATVIPVEKTNQEEYSALIKRMDAFKKAAPGSDAELFLTAHDLNTLIALDPGWSIASGKIHVLIDGGKVGLVSSIPLSAVPQLRERYLNGSLYFTPSIDNKVLHVNVQDIKINNHDLSKEYVKDIATGVQANLSNRLLGDSVIGPVLIKAETLKVENDALVLKSAK